MSWDSPSDRERERLSQAFGGEWCAGVSPYGPAPVEAEPEPEPVLVRFVSAVLDGSTGAGRVGVAATWSASDPFAVSFAFGSTGPVWVFARDLLAAGLESESPAGLGDVRCWSAGPAFMLSLADSDGGGGAVVSFPRSRVVSFVSDTFEVVPAGCESVDWDQVVSQLLVLEGE